MEDKFIGKTLLITGGTGSFGNAVLDRFLDSGIKEIRIFSRDEKKQDDMRHLYNNEKIKFYLGDVRDIGALNYAMKGVNYVFSAAALKQVPSCEFFPLEAVNTNVYGTSNTIDAAILTYAAWERGNRAYLILNIFWMLVGFVGIYTSIFGNGLNH